MMEAMSPFPPIRSSSRTGSPSKASQYDKVMARLYQAENELAAKDQMNTMLQAKLSSLLRKCDSREQKLHTNNIAMRKMESDMVRTRQAAQRGRRGARRRGGGGAASDDCA